MDWRSFMRLCITKYHPHTPASLPITYRCHPFKRYFPTESSQAPKRRSSERTSSPMVLSICTVRNSSFNVLIYGKYIPSVNGRCWMICFLSSFWYLQRSPVSVLAFLTSQGQTAETMRKDRGISWQWMSSIEGKQIQLPFLHQLSKEWH